jgi:hypothetical protein
LVSEAAKATLEFAETIYSMVCLLLDFFKDLLTSNISFWKNFINQT